LGIFIFGRLSSHHIVFPDHAVLVEQKSRSSFLAFRSL